MDIDDRSLLEFPSEFAIKVFGLASDEFEISVLAIVRKHISEINAIRQRHSKDKKYLALSIVITATSREQLDAIYRELNANPIVLMTL